MDIQRLVLFGIFSFSLVMLWEAWQREHRPPPSIASPSGVPVPSKPVPIRPGEAPNVPGSAPSAPAAGGNSELVNIQTDLLVADVDLLGGGLQRVEFIRHKDAKDPNRNFVLLGPEHSYGAQSGLIGEGLPNHRSMWRVLPGGRTLEKGADVVTLRLEADGPKGVTVVKTYVFHRDSYVIDVGFEVRNGSRTPLAANAYFQLVRDDASPAGESAMMSSFTGPAVYTVARRFETFSFSDVAKGKVALPKAVSDGWIAMIQHYFVAAWLPPEKLEREYYVNKTDELYRAGVVLGLGEVAAGGSASVGSRLYVGPQEQKRLIAAAEGLDLVVDFGWLKVIAWGLFWVLQQFHGWTGNWGVAIILLTVSVKLLFFPLSAASYKSMAKMKLVTPRLTKIREMYGDDRQKMNQAMMELYKTEKINPLGGCFPVVVQIPVFLALYWVLLATIELRHAPFMLWIVDLAAQDPYYVLPVLMSASMVLQTKMNPTPPDPVQAKVMAIMPYMFSVFFFFFPAGLVLYWLVNNILSILQQWQIQRMFTSDKRQRPRR